MNNNFVSFSRESFKGSKSRSLELVSIDNIYCLIKLGLSSNKFIYDIGKIRGISLIDSTTRLVNIYKSELPFFYPNGTRKFHNSDYPLSYNGNLHIDLDFKNEISNIGINLLKEKLINDPYIKLLFSSPSGRGLKILSYTNNYDVSKYYNYLFSFIDYLSNIYNIDKKFFDVLSPEHVSFLSFDPQAYLNHNDNYYQLNNYVEENGDVEIIKRKCWYTSTKL